MTTVSVRMYNVGFGDAFVVTVRQATQRWTMLVDCGVHTQGRAQSLAGVVDAIIDDLAREAPDGTPHLDVIVATHRHADHISGFAFDAWERVTVDQVWVPFVEDPADPDATKLREAQTAAGNRLLSFLQRRTHGVDPGAWPATLVMSRWFVLNSLSNQDATDRLLGRNGRRFANTPQIRFLPYLDDDNRITTALSNVTAHILGPSRDPATLKRMNPPSSAGWLALDSDADLIEPDDAPLFNPQFIMPATDLAEHPQLRAAHHAVRRLDELGDADLLTAASILERSLNNTSLFFVLDVEGTHLLFPGDAQEGAWDHVLDNPNHMDLVRDAAFYKISHHGSHNGTPKRFIEEILEEGAYAMLPWGLVKRWKTIPKQELLEALDVHKHRVIRADQPEAVTGQVDIHENLWSEVTFTVP